MDYEHINTFLERFKKIFSDKKEIKKIIIETIKINTNIELEDNDVFIKSTTITIKKSPIVKNEVLIKKEKILTDLNSKKLNVFFTEIK